MSLRGRHPRYDEYEGVPEEMVRQHQDFLAKRERVKRDQETMRMLTANLQPGDAGYALKHRTVGDVLNVRNDRERT